MRGLIILFFLIIICSSFSSATLGISPAVKEIDFEPFGEHEFIFNIINDHPDQITELYIEGYLAEYVKLSKKEAVGPDSFKVTIKFPEEIEKPGQHEIAVGVRETVKEDQFLGTTINIRGVIKVNVPFPGRYLEVNLNIPNGNVNDEIPVEAHVLNKGKEDLNVNVNINFYSDSGVQIFSMPFTPVFLMNTEERYFRKFLDTSGFRSGDYLAEAVVNFEEEIKVNKTFRIGSKQIGVINFTERLPGSGIQKFYVGIESKWNNDLDEVFADVNISNSTKNIGFRTPSIDLKAWKKGTLIGFLDTNGLSGIYKSEIVLNYGGEQTRVFGELTVVGPGLKLGFLVLGLIGILVVVVIVIIVWRFKKKALKIWGRK
jgi:hypothetical protein